MDENQLAVVRRELYAGEGNFLLKLRCSPFTWDKAAFSRLAEAMIICCEAYAHESTVPHWLAERFWRIPHFVRGWTTHPNWARYTSQEPEYYKKAYQLLDVLARWFFTGQHSNDIDVEALKEKDERTDR